MTTTTINIIGTIDWDNEVEEFANRSIVLDIQSTDTVEKFLKKTCSIRSAKKYGDFDVTYEIDDDETIKVYISTVDETYFRYHNGMTAGTYMALAVERFGDYLTQRA